MEYLSTSEVSKIWGISQRRVAIFCKEGRVKGAVLKGNMWLIPKGSIKPNDPRKQTPKEQRRKALNG